MKMCAKVVIVQNMYAIPYIDIDCYQSGTPDNSLVAVGDDELDIEEEARRDLVANDHVRDWRLRGGVNRFNIQFGTYCRRYKRTVAQRNSTWANWNLACRLMASLASCEKSSLQKRTFCAASSFRCQCWSGGSARSLFSAILNLTAVS